MNRKTKAILPSGSQLNPKFPERNEFYAGWGEMTYLYCEETDVDYFAGRKPRKIIIASSGSLDDYSGLTSFEAHHDQTLRYLGHFRVVSKADHAHVGDLPYGARPLYVFK